MPIRALEMCVTFPMQQMIDQFHQFHVSKICRFWVHETPHEGQVKRIKDIPA
jgi:hypothetical protein